VGYDQLSVPVRVLEVLSLKNKTAVVLDASAAYAEMGGQVGDTGELTHGANVWRISNTQKTGHTWLHFLDADDTPPVGSEVLISVDADRRGAIQRHHSVTQSSSLGTSRSGLPRSHTKGFVWFGPGQADIRLQQRPSDGIASARYRETRQRANR